MDNSSSMPEQIPDQELLRETFHKIIEIFPELGISRKSPKFFILYAHENEELNIEANRNVVDDYISWFMSVRLNVDSDKSPNGYGLVNGPAHSGATSDIVRNQVCLLPPSFHHLNVKYVLVFYSRLLAKYMKDERDWKGDTQTYSEALYKACEKYERESKIPWNEVCDTVEQVQEEYDHKMGLLFHQSLTELALLKYRNKSTKSKYTIPILMFNEKKKEADLKWLPEFVGMKSTGIQIRMEPGKHYHTFFKILLMFEEFEMDRPLIIAMEECFKEMVDILKKQKMPREQYRLKLATSIAKAVRGVSRTDMYWMVDKSVPAKDAKGVLLDSLYKEEVFYRQKDDSLDPFQNTFNWLWGEKPHFRDWLQSGNGIYWISGLPGSGKSTLMKYALDHRTTSEALQKSDSSYQMKVAFFFYNRGQLIQKSFTGLLRSILYQIIMSAEETVTTILPIYSELHHDPFKREWTITSLKKALRAVKAQKEIRLDICLFIDALDEYDGDDFEMAQFMADLTHESEFTNIKICLSSRPDPAFTGFFSKCLGLKIDDYTAPDISHYVRSNLTRAKNAMLSEMTETTILIIDRITEYIINHAHGVFLWVSIVVVDVTARLLNGDDPIEIEKTLLDIPTTDLDHRGNSKTSLDMLYQHILEERIPRSQCVQAYQMLEIARCGSSVPLECFSLFFDIIDSPTGARVPEYAMEMSEQYQGNNERVQSRSDRMVLQLQRQCRGLLVLKTKANDPRKTQFVELLHGTLRDYLNIPKNLDYLFSTESKPTKNGYYYLMQGFLSLVEQRQLPWSIWWDSALLFGEWAQKAEKSMGALANPIVQSFGSKEPQMKYWNHCIETRDYGRTGINTIEEFATAYNLYLFMKQRIKDEFKCPNPTPKDKTPLLHHALRDNRALHLSEQTDPRVVKLLLEDGADPKEERGVHFPLQLATFTNSGEIKNPNLEILELLLKFGAGANTEFKFRTGHQLSFLSSKSHPSQKRHKTYLLHIAVERQNIKMMDLLFDHGALPNLENLQQETPLFIACRSLLDKPGPTGSEMVNKLLDHGALFTAETEPLLEKLRDSLWYENRWHEQKYRSESQSRL